MGKGAEMANDLIIIRRILRIWVEQPVFVPDGAAGSVAVA
jgi:hypothetical protein